jgi:hypothetical protein
MRFFNRAWLPPLLTGLYAPLALIANNIGEIELTDGLRALAASVLISAALMGVVQTFVRPAARASLLTVVLLALFFFYGHIYNALGNIPVTGFEAGRHRFLIPVWALLAAAAIWRIWRISKSKRDFTGWIQTLTIMVSVALLFPIGQLAGYQIGGPNEPESKVLPPELAALHLPEDDPAPDIYYIILDGYARQDVLLDIFHFDNTPFLSELEEMGFFVAQCSRSNYAQTKLSLSSSLNSGYLEDFIGEVDRGREDNRLLEPFLSHSAVRQTFENLGYRIIAFETGYPWTELKDADLYLAPEPSNKSLLWGGLTPFEALALDSTAALIVTDTASLLSDYLVTFLGNPERIHRERVLFTLEQLERIPAMEGPKFVFAHIVSPHAPFVFGPNGEAVIEEENEIKGYREQVIFLNATIAALVETIMEISETPPIIIIQADHGGVDTSKVKRMEILNAYYLPGIDGDLLYDTITPVNTFRIVFNAYFGGSFSLLEDTSLFSTYQTPFAFEEIPADTSRCGLN